MIRLILLCILLYSFPLLFVTQSKEVVTVVVWLSLTMFMEKKMAGQVEEMRKVHWRVSGETQRWSIYGTSFPDFGVS